MNEYSVVVTGGRFKGETFRVENELSKMPGGETDLATLWLERGNFAAKNAMEIDGYNRGDAPFYYGKIGSLGYIISHKDLPEIPPEF